MSRHGETPEMRRVRRGREDATKRRLRQARWARAKRASAKQEPTEPRVSLAFEEAMRRREMEDVARMEANARLVLTASDRAWLATKQRRCRCQECGALSASSVCPRGHTINQLPTEGAA